MATRNLGSLTTADLGRAFAADGVRGALVAVRHFLIDGTPDARAYTSALVKVPSEGRGANHREVQKASSVSVEVT